MSKAKVLLGKTKAINESKKIATVADLQKISHSAGGSYGVGPQRTSLYKTGHGTENGIFVGLFTVEKRGLFTDFPKSFKPEVVYEGEKLAIAIDDGRLISIESPLNMATTPEEGLNKLISGLDNKSLRSSLNKVTDSHEFKKHIDSTVRALVAIMTITKFAYEYGNMSRSIIKNFGQ